MREHPFYTTRACVQWGVQKRNPLERLFLVESMPATPNWDQLRPFQSAVDSWTGQFKPQYWPNEQILGRLAEEVGEVSREINHLHGVKKKQDGTSNLCGELGDVIFTCACLANKHTLDLVAHCSEYSLDERISPHQLLRRLVISTGHLAENLDDVPVGIGPYIGRVIHQATLLGYVHNLTLDALLAPSLAKCYGRDNNRFERLDKR